MTREGAIELLDILPLCNGCNKVSFPYSCGECVDSFLLAMEALKQPEIVRCKDCNNRGTSDCPFEETALLIPSDDWFCADGEKKDE
jgi:DNA-directed RNA polymerase subunit RPC12/RpoP